MSLQTRDRITEWPGTDLRECSHVRAGVVLPRSDSSLGTPDATSVFVLQCLHPALLKSVSPLSVEADGNCLYRSASLSVCGKQDYHVRIRLMVSIELVLNCLSLAMYM